MKCAAIVAIVSSVLLAPGCAEPAATNLNFSVREVPGASPGAAWTAAVDAVREHFHIARMDRATGRIETDPLETQETGQSGRAGDMLGAQRRVRRQADVRVQEADGGVHVYCKVLVQQFESDERRLFARDKYASDIPSETPADQESATTAEQNAAWRNRGRDKVLERQILESILERVGG
jgi:hypothetical protein